MACSSAAVVQRNTSCAWCVGTFSGVRLVGGGHTWGGNRITRRQIHHRAWQQRTRSARLRSIQCVMSNGKDGEENEDEAKDETEDSKSKSDSTDGREVKDETTNTPPIPTPYVDMEMLRRRIQEVEIDDKIREASKNDNAIDVEIEVGKGPANAEDALKLLGAFAKIQELYVIIFTSKSRSDGEGVYSLDINGENIVLAFQNRSEAQRYATLLELQKFPSAKVAKLRADELRAFCTREGYRLGFVPSGSVTMQPPNESAISDPGRWRIGMNNSGQQSTSDNDGSSGLSQDELDLMKRQLENLFGK